MKRRMRIAALVAAATTVSACSDNFLTGGELSTDPNRPTQATSGQLFVGIEAALWAQQMTDPVRISELWVQQFQGGGVQYEAYYNYDISSQTTNSQNLAVYTGGGLIDIRRLEAQALAAHDTLFLGIAQTVEAWVIGTAADEFGDITYTQALTGVQNPTLDPQLAVYDSIQTLLSRALTNMSAKGPTNFGPGAADLVYGGNAAAWARLAHTLKARFLMHTAEVRPSVFAQVITEARSGMQSPADDYAAIMSGNAGEQNLWYQFDVVQRPGYLLPDPQFVGLLKSRNDPRLSQYFNPSLTDLADSLIAANHNQRLVTAHENLLLWAEAAARTGDNATAIAKLNQERAIFGLGPLPATGIVGRTLLSEILLEEYISGYQTLEPWNLYKRTCTPNLVPVTTTGTSGGKIPARFFYDASEASTNTNIPPESKQPLRNANDPANAVSDATGQKCVGQ